MSDELVTSANAVTAALLQDDADGAGALLDGMTPDEAGLAAYSSAIALAQILREHLPPATLKAAIEGAQTYARELAGDQ